MKKLLTFLLIFSLLASPCWAVVDCNGDADYIIDSSVTGLPNSSGTMAFWMNPDDLTPAGLNVFFAISDGGDTDRVLFYQGSGGSQSIFIFISAGGSGGNVWQEDTAEDVFTEGIWTHVLIAWDTTTDIYNVYTDGTLFTPDSTNVVGNPSGINEYIVCANAAGSNFYANAQINDIAVWDTVLGASEALLLSQSRTKRLPLQISPSNLILYIPLDDNPDGSGINNATYLDMVSGTTGTGVDADGDSSNLAETFLTYP